MMFTDPLKEILSAQQVLRRRGGERGVFVEPKVGAAVEGGGDVVDGHAVRNDIGALRLGGVAVDVDAVRGVAPHEQVAERVRAAILAEFDAIAIAIETGGAVEDGGEPVSKNPRVFNCHSVLGFPKIKPIVGVFPRAGATHHVAGTEVAELDRKPIGILTAGAEIEIGVGVTVEDEIVCGRTAAGNLKAGVLVLPRDELFEDVVRAANRHAVVRGELHGEALQMPVAAIEANPLLPRVGRAVGLAAEVENRSFPRIGPQLDGIGRRATATAADGNRRVQIVSSATGEDGVTGNGQPDCFAERGEGGA